MQASPAVLAALQSGRTSLWQQQQQQHTHELALVRGPYLGVNILVTSLVDMLWSLSMWHSGGAPA
jgi:hypothetical protein